MTAPMDTREGLIAGLEQLLAAVHADDPKREVLVRVGDAIREAKALPSDAQGKITAELMNATTVSCTGNEITIFCNDHDTKDALMDALTDAAYAPPSTEAPAQGASMLWCCHVRGPDDVYAAPDYETALAWSDLLNAMNWRGDQRYPKPLNYKNPTSFEDCLIKATPAPWPHSPESHAEDMPKSVAGFAEPSPIPSPVTETGGGVHRPHRRSGGPMKTFENYCCWTR